MKETLEKLWNEYIADECAVIVSDEERKLTKEIAKLHEEANKLLNKEQKEAVEKFVDAIYDVESFFIRKAFIKGCEFSVSFMIEAGNINNHH